MSPAAKTKNTMKIARATGDCTTGVGSTTAATNKQIAVVARCSAWRRGRSGAEDRHVAVAAGDDVSDTAYMHICMLLAAAT